MSVVRSNLLNQYWTIRQQIIHLTHTQPSLGAGTLVASGSVSGAEINTYGSGIERFRERKAMSVKKGAENYYLEDGDEVNISGMCQGDGYTIGFSECKGKVLPSI